MKAMWCWILAVLLLLAATVPGAAAAQPFALAYTLTLAQEDHPTVEVKVTGAQATTTNFTFGIPGSALGAVADLKSIFAPITVTGPDGRPLSWQWRGDQAIVVENGATTDFTIRYAVDGLRIGRGAMGRKFAIFRRLAIFFTADLVFILPAAVPDRITVSFSLPEGTRIFASLPEADGRFVATADLWGNLLDDFQKAYFSGGRPLFDVTRKTEWGDTYHYVWFDRDPTPATWLPSYGTTPWEEAQAYMAETEKLARYFREKIGPLPPRTVLFTNTKPAGPNQPNVQVNTDWYHYMQIFSRGAEADVVHHLFHAYSQAAESFSKMPFADNSAAGRMLAEGLPTYFELTVPGAVLGQEYLRGKLFEFYLLERRGAPFGIAANEFQRAYNRSTLQLYLLNQYLRRVTGGQRDVTAFVRALWDQVKDRPHPQAVTEDQIRTAFAAVAGTANQAVLDQIASQTDFPAEQFTPLLPEFRAYMDWMAGHYFAGNRLLFLAFLDVVAAQGNEWPHYATNAHNAAEYRDKVLPAFRQYLAGKSGPLTQADVLAMLTQATGRDHAGFFEFWSALGIDLDPNSLLPLERWELHEQDGWSFLPLWWQSGGVLQTEHYLSGLPQQASALLDKPGPSDEVTVQQLLRIPAPRGG